MITHQSRSCRVGLVRFFASAKTVYEVTHTRTQIACMDLIKQAFQRIVDQDALITFGRIDRSFAKPD